jgi:trehalose synthase
MPLDRFREVLPDDDLRELRETAERAREILGERTIVHVNSTGRGGGVAEMLAALLPYAQGAGVQARWLVIKGDDAFFTVTKRIHNHLHGAAGDGGPLGDAERIVYERAVSANCAELLDRVKPGDLAILHDPQTAGLVGPLRDAGIPVIWRCHVGLDEPNDLARRAWGFLRPYVVEADAYVFSRDAFVWEDLDRERGAIIAPSIDAFAPKNQEIDDETAGAILAHAGIVDAPAEGEHDGSGLAAAP